MCLMTQRYRRGKGCCYHLLRTWSRSRFRSSAGIFTCHDEPGAGADVLPAPNFSEVKTKKKRSRIERFVEVADRGGTHQAGSEKALSGADRRPRGQVGRSSAINLFYFAMLTEEVCGKSQVCGGAAVNSPAPHERGRARSLGPLRDPLGPTGPR